MLFQERLIIALAASLILAAITKKTGVLDNKGVASAFIIGVTIGALGDTTWLVLLLIFLISSFGATKRNFAIKQKMGVQEGKSGERGWRNAWSTGLMPTLVALVAFFDTPYLPRNVAGVVFITAIAAAASDTFASEMGMLYPKPEPVLITNPKKRVPIGTNGGITTMGTLWSFLAAAHMGLWGFVLLTLWSDTLAISPFWTGIAIFMGFMGCQFDSLLGAIYENRGKMSKHAVNFISTMLATIIAWMVVLWI